MKHIKMTLLLALAAGVTVACGGGAGNAGPVTPTLGSAALEGLVVEVDGQTVDRSGVEVEVVETGGRLVTGPDGTFEFDRIPAGTVTLRFNGALAPARLAGNDDSGGDDADDGEDADEDEDGNPRIGGVQSDDVVRVTVALSGGKVTEFRVDDDGRRRSTQRLTPTADAPAGAEAKAKIEQRTDREKFEAEVDHVAAGTTFDFYLDGTRIGSATANTEGEAELEFNTKDGQALPLGATTAAELAGLPVEVRATDGTVLFTGDVPDLPSATGSGAGTGGIPSPGDRARGKARLTPAVAGLEGSVEIKTEPADGKEELEIEAENLAPGTVVEFYLEDPAAPGTLQKIAELAAGDDGEAELEFEDGAPLPFGIERVEDLVGLAVEVRDTLGNTLLSGTIPPLVAD